MKTNCTVFAFLGLIVGLVSSSNSCYVGKLTHKCKSTPEFTTVLSKTCYSKLCGYVKVETRDGCTFVQGFCSESTKLSGCKNQLNNYVTSSGGTKIDGECCNAKDNCNDEAAKKEEDSTPTIASNLAVAYGITYIIGWIIGCVCFWGICAGVITGIVCCVRKSKQKGRNKRRPPHTETTTTTTVSQPQQPVSVAVVKTAPAYAHPAPAAGAYPVTAVGAPVAPVAPVMAVAVPVNAQPYPAAAAYPGAAVAAYPQAAPAVAVVPPTASTL